MASVEDNIKQNVAEARLKEAREEGSDPLKVDTYKAELDQLKQEEARKEQERKEAAERNRQQEVAVKFSSDKEKTEAKIAESVQVTKEFLAKKEVKQVNATSTALLGEKNEKGEIEVVASKDIDAMNKNAAQIASDPVNQQQQEQRKEALKTLNAQLDNPQVQLSIEQIKEKEQQREVLREGVGQYQAVEAVVNRQNLMGAIKAIQREEGEEAGERNLKPSQIASILKSREGQSAVTALADAGASRATNVADAGRPNPTPAVQATKDQARSM